MTVFQFPRQVPTEGRLDFELALGDLVLGGVDPPPLESQPRPTKGGGSHDKLFNYRPQAP